MHKKRVLPVLITSNVIGEKAKFINTDAVGLLDLTEGGFLCIIFFFFIIHWLVLPIEPVFNFTV